jgi:uncharacterized membrane protein YbhN (UPF0104 family)
MWTLKLALTGLILWMALRGVSLSGLQEALLRVDRPLALLSVGLFPLLILPIETARFWFTGQLLTEHQPSFRHWFRIYGESRPFFYLLPASVGAEGLMWIRLRNFNWQHGSCGFVILMTRLVGVGIWALAAALALGYSPEVHGILAHAPAALRLPATWGGVGCLILAVALLAPRVLRAFRDLPLGPRRVAPLAGLLAASVVSAIITGLAVRIAGTAAHTPVTLFSALGFVAFFNFAMVLPISLGGFGVQEALMLAFGLPMGYPPPALLAFSAVIHLQRMMVSSVGLAMFLSDRNATLSALPDPSEPA